LKTKTPLQLQAWQSLGIEQRQRLLALHIPPEQVEFAGTTAQAVAVCEGASADEVAGLALLDADVPIGFVLLVRGAQLPDWAPHGGAALRAMRIDHREQGKGHGKAALALVAGWLCEHWPSCRTLALSVDDGNAAARRTYQAAGFTEYAEPRAGRIGLVRYLSKAIELAPNGQVPAASTLTPMREPLQIRVGQGGDAPRLAVLASQVWLHTYATEGITHDIARHVLSEFAFERLAAALGDPGTVFLVAECGPFLVGMAVVRFGVPCPTGADASVELQTLYVQAHAIGRGVGKALLQAAEAEARERSGSSLWLTVNARNARAIAFYEGQGYSKIGTACFVLGSERHENHVMVAREG
jgi:ribosomal protein S18 acetylase RimI-like enzyme